MSTDTTGGVAAGRVARLATEAADAARVRALTTDPDVIALRVERVRAQVDALLWAGTLLGLAFTMVNVQSFAAAGSPLWSGGWWVAWLLDPMVSLVLLAVLRAEQVTARYQVGLPSWARRTKWLTFAATYVMNTWTSWGLAGGPLSWSGVVLHSVPPLVVFATAETGPGLRDRLTQAVHHALTEHAAASTGAGASAPADTEPVHEAPLHEAPLREAPVREAPVREAPVREAGTGGVHGPAPAPGQETPVGEPLVNPTSWPAPAPPKVTRPTSRGPRPAPRRLLAEFVADATAALERAHAEGAAVEPTPGWCRQVTGCSAGTSVKVAAALATPTPAPMPARADRQEAA